MAKISPRVKSLRNPKIKAKFDHEWLLLENLLKACKNANFTTKEALVLVEDSKSTKFVSKRA